MPMSIWLRTVGKCVRLNSVQLPGDRFANKSNWICVTEEAGERSLTELSRVGTRWTLTIGGERWVLLAVLSPTRAFWLASSASCPLLARKSPPEPPLTEQPSWAFALKPSVPKEISKQTLSPAQPLIELWDVFGKAVSYKTVCCRREIMWHQRMGAPVDVLHIGNMMYFFSLSTITLQFTATLPWQEKTVHEAKT